jgi:serine/threonine protein kinase
MGQHHRIVSFKGKYEDWLLLEYMPNGSIADYLDGANPKLWIQERLKWIVQAAEAVAFIHKKGVLHCDISTANLLLDKKLNIRLYDLQGRLLNSGGTVRRNSESAEDIKSSMPRSDPNDANRKTNIFALGSADEVCS